MQAGLGCGSRSSHSRGLDVGKVIDVDIPGPWLRLACQEALVPLAPLESVEYISSAVRTVGLGVSGKAPCSVTPSS